jgi:hypothetical protein
MRRPWRATHFAFSGSFRAALAGGRSGLAAVLEGR